ncbi:prfA [Symbiodinium natans]|uniref:PrfA protein n=1 Tax=Symbiodinium natans TaxID=878477 RepID=A0A812M5M2_9DINO|nr:prfA [Symbiodinium natans]
MRAIWGCRNRQVLLTFWHRSRWASSAPWQARLLELTQKVPDDVFPSAKVASALESARAFRRAKDAKHELEKQRQTDLSSQDALGDEELAALYDSELQAADDLLDAQGTVLEQELLFFHRSAADGRLDHHDSAAADGRDALLELTPGVGGQESSCSNCMRNVLRCTCCVNEAPPEEVVTAVAAPDTREEETMELKAAFAPGVVKEQEKTEAVESNNLAGMAVTEEAPQIRVVAPVPEKPPAQTASTPAASQREYIVKVRKENGKLGGKLDTSQEDCCVFKSVDSGGVLDKTGVRLYDRLVKVNGKSQQSSELARLVVSDSELELTVERPGAQDVVLNKAGKKVGLRLHSDDTCLGLIVKEVTGGVAADMPKGTFQPKDRIVEVDGKSMSPTDMLKHISENDTVTLKVCSYKL